MVENGINAISNIIPDRATHDTSQNGNGGQTADALDYSNSPDLLPLDPELVTFPIGFEAGFRRFGPRYNSLIPSQLQFDHGSVLAMRSRRPDPLYRTPSVEDVQRVASENTSDSRLKVITVNARLYKATVPDPDSGFFDRLRREIVSWFFEADGTEQRVKLLAEWLKKQDADVIILQEVYQQEWFDILLEESGYQHGVHVASLDKGASDLAIISKHPLTQADFEPIRWHGSTGIECGKDIGYGLGYGKDFRFGLFTANLNLNGQEILVVNVHPMHRNPDEDSFSEYEAELTPERITQLLELAFTLKPKLKGQPVIFGGDFNFSHGQKESEIIDGFFGFADTCNILSARYQGEDLCTFCADNRINVKNKVPGEEVLDHIYVNHRIAIEDAEIAKPDPIFTDHQPVIGYMRLRSDAEIARLGLKDREPVLPLTAGEIERVQTYLDDQWFHPYCWVSDFGQPNVVAANLFLEDIKEGEIQHILVADNEKQSSETQSETGSGSSGATAFLSGSRTFMGPPPPCIEGTDY